MPYDDPEPDDPNMLVGVVLPGDLEAMKTMADSFADEFAALGYGEEQILALFQAPFYAGAHQALSVLGEDQVKELVRENVSFWRHCRIAVCDASPPDGSDETAQEGFEQLVQIEEVPCRR